jgi:prevent-host-death family protein
LQIPITEAKAHLTELVRRAEAGDEIGLTRQGKAAVRLVPVASAVPRARRRAVMDTARQSATTRVTAGPETARSQDFLHGDAGLSA